MRRGTVNRCQAGRPCTGGCADAPGTAGAANCGPVDPDKRTSRPLDARLARAHAVLEGAFDREPFALSAAQAQGVRRGTLHRLVVSGAVVRVSHGSYALRQSREPWVDRLRGLLRASPDLAACGPTAALLTSVAVPPGESGPVPRESDGTDRISRAASSRTSAPQVLHLCAIDGDPPHWRRSGVRFERMHVPASHVIEVEPGMRVTDPMRTAIDLARGRDLACALVPIDSVLRAMIRQGFPADVARSLLTERCREMGSAPGMRAVRRAVGHMDAGAETALESLVRGRLIEADVTGVLTQVVVHGASGRTYRVDLAIEKSPGAYVIIEADGLGKYSTPEDLVREKLRQHDLEDRGHRVIRAIYREAAYEPERLVERVRAALAR